MKLRDRSGGKATALLVNCSPYGERSRAFGMVVEMLGRAELRSSRSPDLIIRDLGRPRLPDVTPSYAQAITEHRTRDDDSFGMSEILIGELERSNLLVIVTPIHNLGVPASLKLWIDHVVRRGRTFLSTPAGKIGLLRDRPTIVVVTSGGFHDGPRASQPDFLSPYLTEILGIVGIRDIGFTRIQGTAYDSDTASEAGHADIGRLSALLDGSICAMIDDGGSV